MPADDGPSALSHNPASNLTDADMSEHAESMYRLYQGEKTRSSLYNWLGAEYEFREFIEAELSDELGITMPVPCAAGETLMLKTSPLLLHMATELMAERHKHFPQQQEAKPVRASPPLLKAARPPGASLN